jgi:tetratricopeptide (TPR) repeat protein
MARARAAYEEALAIFRSLGDRRNTGAALGSAADAATEMGDFVAAQRALEEMLAISIEIGELVQTALAYDQLTTLARSRGELNQAREYAVRNVEVSRDLADLSRIHSALWEFGVLEQVAGYPERATRLLAAAMAVREAGGRALPESLLQDLERYKDGLRQRLGGTAFEDAWAAGGALSQDDAIAYALAGRALPAITTAAVDA